MCDAVCARPFLGRPIGLARLPSRQGSFDHCVREVTFPTLVLSLGSEVGSCISQRILVVSLGAIVQEPLSGEMGSSRRLNRLASEGAIVLLLLR